MVHQLTHLMLNCSVTGRDFEAVWRSVDRWNFAGNPGNTISLGGGKSNVLGIFTPKLGEDFQLHNFV